MKLKEFVESYTEMKKELSEAACEAVEENCNCEYYDDADVCLANCYTNAGLDDCGDDEFEIEKYMECEEADWYDGDYALYYYIGPVIAKGGSAVYLDVFTDASCTQPAESGVYAKYMGSELPYSKENKVSIVNDDCITCQAVVENDGDDQNNNQYYQQASESCTQIYEESGKCEKNLKGKTSSVDNETCNFIHNRLPALERVYKRGGGSSATTAFMWFFLVTTLGASAGAYYFYTIGQRSNVNLGNGGSRSNGRIL